MGSNAEKLRDVGLITGTELPEPYRTVIENLTPQEIEAIVSTKQRLDDAHAFAQEDLKGVPHYSEFFVPF
jgi:hypothetical protein